MLGLLELLGLYLIIIIRIIRIIGVIGVIIRMNINIHERDASCTRPKGYSGLLSGLS